MPESIDDDMMARCTEELFESHSETAQESWTQIHGNIPTEVITGALGVVGLGVSALFLIQGAPDLALTQLLVETVIVVGFG